ncbi:hypothetical protein CITRIK5_30096 [Citricoccus sp. K5]|nr:hypothetical protein CITRIK5_30096 [Citricoccus sp. K5]
MTERPFCCVRGAVLGHGASLVRGVLTSPRRTHPRVFH